MPCDQYELHVQNGAIGANGNPDVAVARLDQRISTVTAIQLGHINVVLDHKSILMTSRCYWHIPHVILWRDQGCPSSSRLVKPFLERKCDYFA